MTNNDIDNKITYYKQRIKNANNLFIQTVLEREVEIYFIDNDPHLTNKQRQNKIKYRQQVIAKARKQRDSSNNYNKQMLRKLTNIQTSVLNYSNTSGPSQKSNLIYMPKKRRAIPLSTRYDILKRDGYRCCLCGRSAEKDGVKLEIDHKIPVAKGGTNDIDNLWTLCFDCNRGKSAKDL